MASVRDLLKGYWLLLAGATPLPRRGRLTVRGGVRLYDDPAAEATVLEIPGGGIADAQGSGTTTGGSSSQILAYAVPENGRARVQIDVYAYKAAYSDATARLITSEHWTVERNGAGTVAVSGQDVISTDGTLAPTIAVNGVGAQLVVTATGVIGQDIAYAARLRVLVGPSGLTGEAIGGAALAPVVVPSGSSSWSQVLLDSTAGPVSHTATVGELIIARVEGGNDIAITLPPITASNAKGTVRVHVAGALGTCNIAAATGERLLNTAGIAAVGPAVGAALPANSTVELQALYDPTDAIGWGGSVWIIANGAPVGAIT